MSDALKWTLRVRVEGLSLWMNRGTHVDVLFPDDGLGRHHAEHHFVRVKGDVDPSVKLLHDLHGHTLDFRTMSSLPPARPATPAVGMLPLTVEAGALATRPDAVLKGTCMVAGLRLPPGQFAGIGSERGPFTFGGDETLFLNHGAVWMMSMFGRRDLQVGVHPYVGVSSLRRIGPKKPATEDVSLLVQCLSKTDLSGNAKISYGDTLPEMACLGQLTRKDTGPLPEVPQYFGPTLKTPLTKVRVTLPDRPCPMAFGSSFE